MAGLLGYRVLTADTRLGSSPETAHAKIRAQGWGIVICKHQC